MRYINFDFFEHVKRNNEETTEEAIIKFEQKYNCKFPDDYKIFLLKYSGGYFYPRIKLNKKDYYANNIYSSKTDIEDFYCLQDIVELLEYDSIYCEDGIFSEKLTPMQLFPIATDGVGVFIFYIGAGDDNRGKIYSYDHQGDYCKDGEELKYLCESFTDFINGFKIIED